MDNREKGTRAVLPGYEQAAGEGTIEVEDEGDTGNNRTIDDKMEFVKERCPEAVHPFSDDDKESLILNFQNLHLRPIPESNPTPNTTEGQETPIDLEAEREEELPRSIEESETSQISYLNQMMQQEAIHAIGRMSDDLVNLHQFIICNCLNQSDLDRISVDGTWLNDRIINCSMQLVLHQKKVRFQDCNNAPYFHKEYGHSLQIVNTEPYPGKHWITVEKEPSAGQEKTHVHVKVFDSGDYGPEDSFELRWNLHLDQSIRSIVGLPGVEYIVDIMGCPRQKKDGDCGVYAIAFLVARANNLDLHNVEFADWVMRNHLRQCLTTGKLTPFPTLRPNQQQCTVLFRRMFARDRHNY